MSNKNEDEPIDSMDISTEEVPSKFSYTCNICKEKYETKNDMMKRRKKRTFRKSDYLLEF